MFHPLPSQPPQHPLLCQHVGQDWDLDPCEERRVVSASCPPHCALRMRQDQRRTAGIWDRVAGTLWPWTPKSLPAVSLLPPGSALAAAEIYGERQGRRASGGVNKRRVFTLSPAPGAVSRRHAAPRVPPGSTRPRASRAAHPARHRDPRTAPQGWGRARSSERLRVFN